MDIICDELLLEAFHRLPPSSLSAVSLVCRRWRDLYRASKTSLSLRFSPTRQVPCVPTLLSHYPFLSSLTISFDNGTTAFSDYLLLSVASCCPSLGRLHFLVAPPSLRVLFSLSGSFTRLTSLTISIYTPVFLSWVGFLPSLKELSIVLSPRYVVEFDSKEGEESWVNGPDSELPLESLSLTGIGANACGVGWLWRSCKKLRKLQLSHCQSIGDGGSFSSFGTCIQGLQEAELTICRLIAGDVLLKLAQNCLFLDSLLVHDGGSEGGLLRFINECRCNLRKLDLRLPFDLHNSHLLAIAQNFRGLSSLQLRSSVLVTGEGLEALGTAMSNGLQELALVNVDVVEKIPGLLTTLGQKLKGLRKLDLSYNHMSDYEIISMLMSCNYLTDLKLRGCRELTGAALVSISMNCKYLESLDIMDCIGIKAEAIKVFVKNSPWLRHLQVEESKLSVFQPPGHEMNFLWLFDRFISHIS